MKISSKIILAILVVIGLYAFSWGITVGLIKLITLCFSIKFNMGYATGFWLLLCLFQLLFGKQNKDKK